MASVGEIVFRAPVTAVNEERDRMRPIAFGHAHIQKLIRILTISEAQIGIGRWCGKYAFAWHGRAV